MARARIKLCLTAFVVPLAANYFTQYVEVCRSRERIENSRFPATEKKSKKKLFPRVSASFLSAAAALLPEKGIRKSDVGPESLPHAGHVDVPPLPVAPALRLCWRNGKKDDRSAFSSASREICVDLRPGLLSINSGVIVDGVGFLSVTGTGAKRSGKRGSYQLHAIVNRALIGSKSERDLMRPKYHQYIFLVNDDFVYGMLFRFANTVFKKFPISKKKKIN